MHYALLFILPWLTALEVLRNPKTAQELHTADGGIHLFNPLRYPGLKQRSKKHDVSKGREVRKNKLQMSDVLQNAFLQKWSNMRVFMFVNVFKVPRRSRCEPRSQTCKCALSERKQASHCILFCWQLSQVTSCTPAMEMCSPSRRRKWLPPIWTLLSAPEHVEKAKRHGKSWKCRNGAP